MAADGPITSESGEGLRLPAGIREDVFVEAVERSGYPLQIVIASALDDRGYTLEEEWAFSDPDTDERRSLDVVALSMHERGPVAFESGAVKFAKALLIECKQSRNPYLFFESVAPPELSHFPEMLGIGSDVVTPRGSLGAHGDPIGAFLSTRDEPLMTAPPIAASLSRAEPKGKEKVLLSGGEAYNSLLMPLIKGFAKYEKQHRGSRPERLNPNHERVIRLVLPIAVIDAPLVFVGRPSEEPRLERTDWVRLIVRHPVKWHRWEHGYWEGGGGFTVVDVIHRSFLPRFLDDYLRPFAHQFFSRFADRVDEILGE